MATYRFTLTDEQLYKLLSGKSSVMKPVIAELARQYMQRKMWIPLSKEEIKDDKGRG